MNLDEIREQATDRGYSAGTWCTPGDAATAERILSGYDAGDPEIMDMCPAPLSGEWAGESLAELGLADATDEELAVYEEAFQEAFWGEVCRSAWTYAPEQPTDRPWPTWSA